MPHHDAVFLLFDGMKHLDIAGPAEVLAEANRFGAGYRLRFASPSGSGVTTSTGMILAADVAASDVEVVDTVIVPGGDGIPSAPVTPEVLTAITGLVGAAERVVSVCTGAFLLAATGLLDGRRATTHWAHTALFARIYPRIEVLPDAIFVSDERFYTSAGVSAGIDLALALVEMDHGPELARDVARQLVVYLQRPGGQSQYSALLQRSASSHDGLRRIIEAIRAHPDGEHDLGALARGAGVSVRHLTRLFHTQLGVTPAKFVEEVRIETATVLLLKGEPVGSAARRAGFRSAETMRRAFTARFGVPPGEYRRRFASAR